MLLQNTYTPKDQEHCGGKARESRNFLCVFFFFFCLITPETIPNNKVARIWLPNVSRTRMTKINCESESRKAHESQTYMGKYRQQSKGRIRGGPYQGMEC